VAKIRIKRRCCDPVPDCATQTSSGDGHFLATGHIEHGVLLTIRRNVRETCAVYANQLVDVLDVPIAQIDETLINFSVDLLKYRAREKNAARFRQVLEASSDIHAVPKNVVSFYDHIAEIDANSKYDHPLVRHIRVAESHALLNCDSTFNGVDGAYELDEHAIAYQLHHSSVVFDNRRIDQFGAMGSQRTKCSNLVYAHESTIADDVCA
jgi:hypothetical protein